MQVNDANRPELVSGYIEWTLELAPVDALASFAREWLRHSYATLSNEQVADMLREYDYPPFREED